jgi:hypothetical protein
MARWAQREVGASIRARPGHGHAPMPTRRSVAVVTKGASAPSPDAPARLPIAKPVAPKPPAGSGVSAPATATAGDQCMRERRRRGREPCQRDKPGQRRVHAQGPVLEARWPGAAGSRVR